MPQEPYVPKVALHQETGDIGFDVAGQHGQRRSPRVGIFVRPSHVENHALCSLLCNLAQKGFRFTKSVAIDDMVQQRHARYHIEIEGSLGSWRW